MEGKVLIKIKDSSELSPTEERLLSWIAITEEFGKPSDKYMDSFMYNFEALIENGNLDSYTKYNANFLNDLCNNQNIAYTGGMLFFNYLYTLKGKSKQEITDGILSWDLEKAREVEEVEMANRVNDRLIHPIVFKLNGTVRGGWKASVKYVPEKNVFILLKGSKIASERVDSCRDAVYDLMLEYQKNGKISSGADRVVLEDLEFKSASEAANMVTLRNVGINEYIADKTSITMVQMLESESFYNRVVEAQGLDEANTKNKEDNTNGKEQRDEEMAHDMIRPNSILSQNKHNLKINIRTHKRGGCDAVAIYSYKFNQWILLSGKICSKPSNALNDWVIEAENEIAQALKDGRLTPNYEVDTSNGGIVFTSIGRLATFCRRNDTTWSDCYIDGTDVNVRDALANKLKYKKYIENKQKDWELV